MKKKHKIIITFLFTFIVVLVTTPTSWDNLNNILQNILVANLKSKIAIKNGVF